MKPAALIGIDLGKHSFHLHAQDSSGREVFRKKTTRQQLMRLLVNQPACTVVMEACAGSHCLAREITALGHEAKLISPQFVRPFVQGNKNDFIDALYNGTARLTLFLHGLVSDTQTGQLRWYTITLACGVLLLVGIGVFV